MSKTIATLKPKTMNKAEIKDKIDEIVLYLIDTEDKDVVNHYSDMIIGVLQLYADEQSREIKEPIENALYATGKFTTEQCTELAEGIILYINEFNQEGERGKRCCGCCKTEIGNCDCHEQ